MACSYVLRLLLLLILGCSGPADATLGDAMTAIDADELDLKLSEDEQDSDIIGVTLSAAATAQVCNYVQQRCIELIYLHTDSCHNFIELCLLYTHTH
jgi:hypothetical protein